MHIIYKYRGGPLMSANFIKSGSKYECKLHHRSVQIWVQTWLQVGLDMSLVSLFMLLPDTTIWLTMKINKTHRSRQCALSVSAAELLWRPNTYLRNAKPLVSLGFKFSEQKNPIFRTPSQSFKQPDSFVNQMWVGCRQTKKDKESVN